MTIKTKSRGAGTRTASNTAFNSRNHTASTDPLIGWHNLAKPARARQQKRGKQRGRIDAYLAGQLAVLAVLVLLIVGGVRV